MGTLGRASIAPHAKACIVSILMRLPLTISGPASAIVRRIWPGFRDA